MERRHMEGTAGFDSGPMPQTTALPLIAARYDIGSRRQRRGAATASPSESGSVSFSGAKGAS